VKKSKTMKQPILLMVIVGFAIVIIAGIIFMNSQSNSGSVKTESITPTVTDQNNNVTNDKSPMNSKTIVDVAVENGNFTTLVAAVKAAGLEETLSSQGPFTVFAPTDEAFAKLPAGTVESLLKDKEKLTKILTYHVVAGKVMAKDVVTMNSAKTVEGSELTIKTEEGVVMINNAKVLTPDVDASNGVIHVIDTVLLPE
jgi:uncharacterized surface protein with fasciclin (FAS1) repeats